MAVANDQTEAQVLPGRGRILPTFTDHAAVLTPLTTKEASDRVVWTREGESAISVLKCSLCNHCVLSIPSASNQFMLYTDASNLAVGGCLHVVRGDTELPVGFFSRILKGPEQRYSVSEKEALAVLSCLDHFDIYLFGRPVMVKTDHKLNLALVSGSSGSTLNPRLRRFSLKLQGRVDQMLYVPGEELTNADGFSRIWSYEVYLSRINDR